MRRTMLLFLAVGLASCNPAPPPAPPASAPATTVPVTTMPCPDVAPDLPDTCKTAVEKGETDALMSGGTCLVTKPAKDHCDRIKAGGKFKWKFDNQCKADVYAVTVVDPKMGVDLKNCSTIPRLKQGEKDNVECEVVAGCGRWSRYHITWKQKETDTTPQVYDPILDIRKGP